MTALKPDSFSDWCPIKLGKINLLSAKRPSKYLDYLHDRLCLSCQYKTRVVAGSTENPCLTLSLQTSPVCTAEKSQ